MINRTEYIITVLFWIPMSILCSICVVPCLSEIVPFAFNVYDMIALILISVFGIIRIILSIIQFNGRRFYGRRDLYDIFSGLLMMILIPTLLLLGHVEIAVFPADPGSIVIMAVAFVSFLLFMSIAIRARRKYVRTRQELRQYFERQRDNKGTV